jgi:hypothetical protein
MLKQETHESIPSFWAKIQKYGNQLGYTPAQKKTSLMSGVRHNILNGIITISRYKPINDILDSLEEMELRRGILGSLSSYSNYSSIPPNISNIMPRDEG